MGKESEVDEAAEERLAIKAESGVEPEALKAEAQLAAGVEKSDDFDIVEADKEDDDGFSVPSIGEAAQQDHAGPKEIFRTIPAQKIREEMQMAFLDARLIIHNTFDHVTEDESTAGAEGRLKKDLDFKEYVELVTKVGITLAIARFTSMGIRQ